MTKKQKALLAVNLLKERYPVAECSLVAKNAHELLIATRLSAQCTDKRVNIVTKDLFEKYRTIDDFANALLDFISDSIAPELADTDYTKNPEVVIYSYNLSAQLSSG